MAAPKGNTNALKHGLYAKHFSPEERARLRNMSPTDYRHEINMMRVAVENMFKLQDRLAGMLDDPQAAGQPVDKEALARITNSLAVALTALDTTARTHALLNADDTVVNDAFEQAINSLSIFLDEPHLLESGTDSEDQEEIVIQ